MPENTNEEIENEAASNEAEGEAETAPEVNAEDDMFGTAELENLDIEAIAKAGEDANNAANEDDSEEEDEEEDSDGDDDGEEEGEDETLEGEEDKPKRKNTAKNRISKLSGQLKDKDAELERLRQENANLKAGKDYLKSQEKGGDKEMSLDDQLKEAAQLAGDDTFDLDDYDTVADKKNALRGYRHDIEINQTKQLEKLNGVKNSYMSVVNQYKEKDENVANGLVASYNAAVANEAQALLRRYGDRFTKEQAIREAERSLLEEAADRENPILHIAEFGKQILTMAGAGDKKLSKKKEDAKIDHKNRDFVKKKAGKPEVENMPSSQKAMGINKEFEKVSSEW